ncbi:fimbrial protein [Escherichia coli]|uniref:fimbrial protein n=1 Tax=Escherichia coli TaxID=562 RepID=UPI002FF2EEC5
MKKTIMSLAVVSALFSGAAMASDLASDGKADNSASTATLNFTGKVTSSLCQVETSNITQTIALGDVSASLLKETGKRGASKSFSVKLVNCDPTVSDISYVIRDANGSSAAGASTSKYLTPVMNDLSAHGVGVYIVDNNDKAVDVGSTVHYGIIKDDSNHALSEQTISLGAYIGAQVDGGADVTAGTVDATGVMTIKATTGTGAA